MSEKEQEVAVSQENEDKLHVHVSGKAVFKAIKQLLSNDQQFLEKLNGHVSEYINKDEAVQLALKSAVRDMFSNDPQFKEELDRAMHPIIDAAIKAHVKRNLDHLVKQSMYDMFNRLTKGNK